MRAPCGCDIVTSEFFITSGFMKPEQMRMARACLNWSLDQLAEASGVHRNTISNFETGKYAGDPEKVAMVKSTLESRGIIFIEEDGEGAGVQLRRFRVGDKVRFRSQTTARLNYDIQPDEIGTVVGVEPHPPQTGPTYRIEVQFPRALVAYVFRYEYELVKATPISLKGFIESSGRSMIPPSHFIVNPNLDIEPKLETNLKKLPKEIGSFIIIPTSDEAMRSKVDACFWAIEITPALTLMYRQFSDGVLNTNRQNGVLQS